MQLLSRAISAEARWRRRCGDPVSRISPSRERLQRKKPRAFPFLFPHSYARKLETPPPGCE
jgi:hypothetical protein